MDEWAEALAAARLRGGESPAPPRRLTLDEGYAAQARVAARLGAAVGWKVGATSDGAMRFLGVAEPIRGRLFAERIFADGAEIVAPAPVEAEPEVMLALGRDLPPDADPRPAVARAALTAELVRPTRPDPFEQGVGFIVADNAAAWGVLAGPDLPLEALGDPAGIRAMLTAGDARTEGAADAVLGDPLRALAWLARHLGGLRAGDVVMTGAMARAIPVPAGATLTLDCAHGRASAKILVMPAGGVSH